MRCENRKSAFVELDLNPLTCMCVTALAKTSTVERDGEDLNS